MSQRTPKGMKIPLFSGEKMMAKYGIASSNELVNTESADGKVAGFWLGLWHGFIAPLTFIISLFNEDVGIYEAHNNGRWYNFGYIFGLTMILGGSKGGGSWGKPKRVDGDDSQSIEASV